MSISRRDDDAAARAVAPAWTALHDHLEQRTRDLHDEVRRYPTPIAHCDDQLPKLLEQRSRAVRVLKLANQVNAMSPNATSTERFRGIAAFLRACGDADDDDVENALRE